MRSCLSRDSEVLQGTGVQTPWDRWLPSLLKKTTRRYYTAVVVRSYSEKRPTQLVKTRLLLYAHKYTKLQILSPLKL